MATPEDSAPDIVNNNIVYLCITPVINRLYTSCTCSVQVIEMLAVLV